MGSIGRRGGVAAVLLLLASGCGGGSGSGAPAGGGTVGGSSAADPVDASPLAATGTIAYVRGSELRAVEPDGAGDRLVWAAPPVPGSQATFGLAGAVWRPDGLEIAFTSDHEAAVSPFQVDVFAVRPDGKALRKITNGPTRERMITLPKGSVRVRVTNGSFDAGPYFVILLGAPEPKLQTIAPGSSVMLTFDGVADVGAGLQPIVVATGAGREIGVSGADVQPGQTVESAPFTIGGSLDPYGAQNPFWSADGARIGFFTAECRLQATPATAPAGASYQPLVQAEGFVQTCSGEWGPTAATAREILLTDVARAGDAKIDLLRVTEGATARPAPFATIYGFRTPDVHWLPDASGFYVAAEPSLTDSRQLYEYRFATGQLTRISNVQLAAPANLIRRFAVSPDGRRVAFERTDELTESLETSTDLWIMDRDGSNARLLARGGREPSWNPTR